MAPRRSLTHKGCIAEVGDHADLVARAGIYHQLVRNQLDLEATASLPT